MLKSKLLLVAGAFIAMCLITGITGCKENDTLPQTCSNGVLDADETGIDCGGSCTACAACNTYLPLKLGNKWIYYRFSDNSFQGVLTIVKDTVINGSTFFKVERTDTADNYYAGFEVYFRNSGGDIFEISDDGYDLFSNSMQSSGNEQLILKENAAVGDSWTVTTGITRSIIEKGGTLIVNGRTYTDVVRVREVYNSQECDYWYAKCVGLIQQRVSSPNLLIDYTIN
ncbi:MAG TPA: hypothetical protein VK154_18255 [Chitinophagales bacterium]|nr:hypothetical protein [Chitinophagales bacterium]